MVYLFVLFSIVSGLFLLLLFYYKKESAKYYEKLLDEKNKNRNLERQLVKCRNRLYKFEQKEVRKTKKHLLNEVDGRGCAICESHVNPNLIHIYKGNPMKECHIDADIIICDSCIGKCEYCQSCLLPIKTDEIKNVLGDFSSLYFCHCDNK